MSDIPSKYDPATAEAQWAAKWEEWGIFKWDPDRPREETFVVDTPPPTVSGSLHIGHVFSYTHQDLLARFHRMLGKNIFYGMGWDDNGLPTERRVQNVFGVKCEPQVPYDADWTPRRDKGKKDPVETISRRNFIEICEQLTEEDEQTFEALWRRMGLSIDWDQTYATIDERSRRTSQWSFVDLYEKGLVYNTESPTMWDTDFRTAVAQAEVEDRERDGKMYDIRFAVEGGGEFTISTTRPELLPACIAVVAHPDDERYQSFFGKKAISPLFKAPVPIMAADHAEPEKGTGILMVCTFGDIHDVDWWKASELPLKRVIGMDGKLAANRFGEAPFLSLDVEAAQAAYDKMSGLYVNQARKAVLEMLAEEGTGPHGEGVALTGEPRKVKQAVKYYEKGDRPLEFVPTRQWFINILDHKEDLLAQGKKIAWHPSHMAHRYQIWVEGLNQDWCISRQRYFGVPFPVWYPIGLDGVVDYNNPILAPKARLPVDPMSEAPPGYTEVQRDLPGGFTGDPDVMDTWATSSVSPLIQSMAATDPERHAKLFPMDIRPQSHEIIRTWAFYTIVKAWMHFKEVPWHNVVISGWVVAKGGAKISKSKGNAVQTPADLLTQHSVDAVRYWTSRARMGTDTAMDEKVFKIGNRLSRKVFNACRFTFMQIERAMGEGATAPDLSKVIHPVDISFLAGLQETVRKATESFEGYEPAGALQAAEESFWDFCDDYLELVKSRSYAEEDTPERASAIATLSHAIKVYLRLLAPFIPYVTEEVWSWRMATEGNPSVHTAAWPTMAEFAALPTGADSTVYRDAASLLAQVRSAKSTAKKSLRWPVVGLTITGADDLLAAIKPAVEDIRRSGNVAEGAVTLASGEAPEGARFGVEVVLGDEAES